MTKQNKTDIMYNKRVLNKQLDLFTATSSVNIDYLPTAEWRIALVDVVEGYQS